MINQEINQDDIYSLFEWASWRKSTLTWNIMSSPHHITPTATYSDIFYTLGTESNEGVGTPP